MKSSSKALYQPTIVFSLHRMRKEASYPVKVNPRSPILMLYAEADPSYWAQDTDPGIACLPQQNSRPTSEVVARDMGIV